MIYSLKDFQIREDDNLEFQYSENQISLHQRQKRKNSKQITKMKKTNKKKDKMDMNLDDLLNVKITKLDQVKLKFLYKKYKNCIKQKLKEMKASNLKEY